MKKYIITDNKEKFIQDDLNESYEMEYVVWVLDGDDNQWKKYKGAHTDEIDKDAFLKSINYKVYPNFDIASNFIDVKVLPAGKSPMDESCGKTTDGKTIEGEFSKDGKTFTDKDGNEYPVNDGGEIIEESRYNRRGDEKDYTEIDTGLTDDRANDVLRSVIGQLSDGMWENSPRMEQYWNNLDVDGGKIKFYKHTLDSYRDRWLSPFYSMSPDELKAWYITKIKQIVRAEGLKWNKNNDQVSQYLDYDSGVTVADAYRVCDAIKNGKVTKYEYDWQGELKNNTENNDKIEESTFNFKEENTSKNQDEYSNIKINVYDIKKFVEQNTDGKYIPFDYNTGAAILLKPDGSGCIVDFEAIGELFNSVNDTIVLRLNDVPEKGKFYIMPQYDAEVTIKEIIDSAPEKTMTVDEFFTKRNYNSRCIQNFDDIKEYLKPENIDKVEESVVNFDKYEYDLGGYANALGEQLSEFLSKANTLVDDSVISEDELKLLMDASDLLKDIKDYI